MNLSVTTPYPGTEIWQTEQRKLTTRDYRLFDIQHAVLPTTLPLPEFYAELVKTQQVLNSKHLGVAAVRQTLGIAGKLLLRGQTNFLRMIWKFNSVFNPVLQLADHARPVQYELPLRPEFAPVADKGRSMCTSRRDDAGVLWTMRQSSLSKPPVSVLVQDERNGTVRDAGRSQWLQGQGFGSRVLRRLIDQGTAILSRVYCGDSRNIGSLSPRKRGS